MVFKGLDRLKQYPVQQIQCLTGPWKKNVSDTQYNQGDFNSKHDCGKEEEIRHEKHESPAHAVVPVTDDNFLPQCEKPSEDKYSAH